MLAIKEPLHGLCNPFKDLCLRLTNSYAQHHACNKNKILLFGASPITKGVIDLLQHIELENEIVGIIDNNPEKQNWNYLGTPILSLEKASSLNANFIIICVADKRSAKQIANQILTSSLQNLPFVLDGFAHPEDEEPEFQQVYSVARSHSIVNKKRLYQLYKLAKYASFIDGSFLEFGCYMGGSSYTIAKAIQGTNKNNDFHVFDTFEGMPDYNDPVHYKGYLAYPFDAVNYLLKEFSNAQVKKIDAVGLQENDIPEQIAFCSIDTDTYQSYARILNLVYPRMKKGGIMFFDDYYSYPRCSGASIAVDNFFSNKPEEVQTGEGAFIIKL